MNRPGYELKILKPFKRKATFHIKIMEKNHSIYGNEYLDHKRFYVAKHVKDPYLDVHHKQIDVRIRQSNFLRL